MKAASDWSLDITPHCESPYLLSTVKDDCVRDYNKFQIQMGNALFRIIGQWTLRIHNQRKHCLFLTTMEKRECIFNC